MRIARTTPLATLLYAGLFLIAGIAGAADWGDIKGKVVWAGDDLPKAKPLDVTKDPDHCLKKGPILDQTFVVNPKNKGVRYVFVYLRKKPGKIHPDYPQDTKQTAEADRAAFEKLNGFAPDKLKETLDGGKAKAADLKAPVLIDQLNCVFEPHSLAAREGQMTLVLNKEPIPHNVKVTSVSGKNDANSNLPPGTAGTFQWVEDKGGMTIECSIHGWMRMNVMVFDHPYFAVTDEDGAFELKNVPAGEVELVVKHPPGNYIDAVSGGKGTGRGAKISVKAGETTDLKEIKFSKE